MTRRRSDGQRTRERVLDVAIPLFAKHGFAGTSIRMIAGAAEVNVATLAYHFVDKEGLYDAVVTRLHEDLVQAFPDDLLRSDDPERLLREIVLRVWGFCREHREHNRLLLRHVLDQGTLPSAVTERWTDQLMAKGTAFVRLFRPDWSETRARLLINAVQHLVVRWVLESSEDLAVALGNPEDPETAIIDFLVELIRGQLGLPEAVAGAASTR